MTGNQARRIVGKCVKTGVLPKVTTLICVDCDEKAQAYDHRNYNLPLHVEPVCHACNLNRKSTGPLRVHKRMHKNARKRFETPGGVIWPIKCYINYSKVNLCTLYEIRDFVKNNRKLALRIFRGE